MKMEDILKMSTGTGRNGIHISAQLRVDGMQLQSHRIGWAANTMERAAQHIDAIENLLALNLYHCRAWDDEATVLAVTDQFPNAEAARAAVNAFLKDFGDGWNCKVTEVIQPTNGEGFHEQGKELSWTYAAVEYELCAYCDHFIEENSDYTPESGYCTHLHLENGEQEFDHDATPSGEIHTDDEWGKLRPDLFIEHPDGAVGPNSIHHSQRGKLPRTEQS